MKTILCILLGVAWLVLPSTVRADSSDEQSVTISISKSCCCMAKVILEPTTKKETVSGVCVLFTDDASWDNVKDTYSVSPAIARGIEHKKIQISIAEDGTATFQKAQKCKKSTTCKMAK